MIYIILGISIFINLFVLLYIMFELLDKHAQEIKSRKFQLDEYVWIPQRNRYGKIKYYCGTFNNHEKYEVYMYHCKQYLDDTYYDFELEKLIGDDIPPFEYIYLNQGQDSFKKNGWKQQTTKDKP